MEYSLENNQKFIESIILYEVNNWTAIDKISENLRKYIGKEVFGNDRKLDSLSELSIESIAKLLKDMDMKDVYTAQKDQTFIRSVIFYEVHLGEEKDKIYEKLLRRIGSDVIDYTVFSHWFDRFKNGSPTFSDLPIDVIGVVVEKLELKEQLSLRKVSRNLRTLVDKRKPAYKSIKIDIKHNYVIVSFNYKDVMYCDTGFNEVAYEGYAIHKSKGIRSNDYVEIAFNDVAIAMKNPKLQLECLEFENNTSENAVKIYEKMKILLETLNHKISVTEFLMVTNEHHKLFSILQYLKPGVLEMFEVWGTTNCNIDEIVVLDQWKYASEITIYPLISSSIEHFLHFKRFQVKLHSLSVEDLIRIRDVMLTSSKFQYLGIDCDDMPSLVEIKIIFGLQTPPFTTPFTHVYSCPIQNSNEFFKFEISHISLDLFITRLSR